MPRQRILVEFDECAPFSFARIRLGEVREDRHRVGGKCQNMAFPLDFIRTNRCKKGVTRTFLISRGILPPDDGESPFLISRMIEIPVQDVRAATAENQLEILFAAEFQNASAAHVEFSL